MPSYSYTSGTPIGISALNPSTGQFIEVIFTASGTTYSYGCIAWLPEIPIEDQVLVYTRPSSLGPETAMINGTDFEFGLNETIVFNSAPSGEVVIRRSTDLSKMVLNYTDGAKLSARQLNATMHQLLFIAQEKANFETNISNYYPVSIVASVWNSGTIYDVNDVVIYNGTIYVSLTGPQSNNTPSSSPAVWKAQNPLSNGFYITGYDQPVNIHLGAMQENQTLVWSAANKRFQSGFAINSSGNLSDYALTSPLNNHILSYFDNKWRNFPIQWTQTLTGTDLILSKHIFTSVLSSYADNTVTLPGYLIDFNRSGTEQVMTNASTVYHLLKKTIPSEEDPKTYFLSVSTQLNAAVQNLKNPVKAKLEWDLAYGNQTQRAEGSVALYGPYTAFWDHPRELYSVLGNGNVWYHGVLDTGNYYKVSPWWSFRATAADPGVVLDLKSKIHGYGISNFYLSLPESMTSCFHIPVVTAGSFTLASSLSSIADNGDHNQGSASRDMYLMALRDMAFAAARPGVPTSPNVSDFANPKTQDNSVRLCKGRLIQANYDSWGDFQFRRLEQTTEVEELCVWKIPANIIYYNTAALALANKDLGQNYIDNVTSLRNTVRFQGYSRMAPNDTLSDSLVKSNRNGIAKPMGYYFKADAFWSDWNQAWTGDTGNYLQRFNEADIDWALWDLTNTTIKHFDTTASVLFDWNTSGLFAPSGPTLNRHPASNFFPWSFRPNQVKEITTGTRQVGSHLLNIDANTLFSSSSNFVPDPVDTYVFRLVLNPTITAAYFKETTPNSKPILNSAILLEYGFRDSGDANTTVPIGNNKSKIYPTMNADVGMANKANSKSRVRLDKSNVVCRIISEQLEEDLTDANKLRYVAKIAITVPRLKSIGYSKVFRKFAIGSTNTDYPSYNSGTTSDTEIDSGPWSFHLDMDLQKYSVGGTTTPVSANLVWNTDTSSAHIASGNEVLDYGTISNQYANNGKLVAGRNECAVKFTRIGIPSDFWLRVSILNTDASVSLIDPANLDFIGE